jgi:hypothetical protein
MCHNRSMSRGTGFLLFAVSLFPLAAQPERDFSGNWVLDRSASRLEGLPADAVPATLAVVQERAAIRCTAPGGAWSYLLDGSETRRKAGSETYSSVVKWEGAALLVNTLVSGPQNYTVMDRWRLGSDRATLTVTRQVVRRGGEAEGLLTYRREGSEAASRPVLRPEGDQGVALQTRGSAPQAEGEEIVVQAGTRVPLSLRNNIDTKHSKDGDRIYLETLQPIFVNGAAVIPRGSFVNGTVTQSKQPGRGKNKGELFIRFDTLTLPNGVTRDFRSRLASADTAGGKVDREEGKVTGERDTAKDTRTVATTTAGGASIGGIAGRSVAGAGIGAAVGAAAGLGAIFGRRGPDASLPQGTVVEMVLDRDLRFTRSELAGGR